MRRKIYAIYKGEDFIFEGTSKECAEYLNIKIKTVQFYNTQAYKRRWQTKKKNGKERNRIIAIVIGEV